MKSNLNKWHEFIATKNTNLLDQLLADDIVFHSPVVFTPQKGKMITKLYLTAAAEVLGSKNADFTYVNKVIDKNRCVLEFSALIEGIEINGVDIIEFDKAGKIVDFKVMIRPLQAIHKVNEKMTKMLEHYKGKRH